MEGARAARRAVIVSVMFCVAILGSGETRACACCGTYKVVNVAEWDVLNVRSGPGAQFRKIGALSPGEGCVVLTGERADGWVRIEAQGYSGWVNAYYLAMISAPDTTPAPKRKQFGGSGT